MFELNQVGAHTYYIESPAKIGLYRLPDGSVCLIDSGNDKDAGRKVRQILDKNGWPLRAICHTHSNADHIGGSRYLQLKTGCRVFAGGIEADFTRHPLLETSFLYGGFPPGELRHKFLMAQESDVTDFSDPAFPRELTVLPLPGHFFDMVGFRTPDDVVFLADCLSSRETLDKYGVPFIYDVEAYLATLAEVENMSAALFVPSHASAAEDIRPLARYNRDRVLEIGEVLQRICREAQDTDAVIRQVFETWGLAMSMEQYVLVGSTVRSFLSWLHGQGRMSLVIEGSRLLWQTQ